MYITSVFSHLFWNTRVIMIWPRVMTVVKLDLRAIVTYQEAHFGIIQRCLTFRSVLRYDSDSLSCSLKGCSRLLVCRVP